MTTPEKFKEVEEPIRVVRCNDCIYYNGHTWWCNYLKITRPAWWYCGDGYNVQEEEKGRELKENFIMEKIRPNAKIKESYGDDGRAPRRVWIEYYCPTCGRYIGSWKKDTACDRCGTFYDWGDKEPQIKTTETIEW